MKPRDRSPIRGPIPRHCPRSPSEIVTFSLSNFRRLTSKAVARQDSSNTINKWYKLPILGILSTDAAFVCAKDMADEYQHEAIQHSHLSGRLNGRGS